MFVQYAWIEKHFGHDFLEKVILTRDKTLIAGDFLIDDKPDIQGEEPAGACCHRASVNREEVRLEKKKKQLLPLFKTNIFGYVMLLLIDSITQSNFFLPEARGWYHLVAAFVIKCHDSRLSAVTASHLSCASKSHTTLVLEEIDSTGLL